MGPGVQRHHQHRDLRARTGDLRLHPRRQAGRLLLRRLPRPARRRPPAVREGARRVLGGRRHPGGLQPGPPGRPRRQGGRGHRRLPAGGGGLARRGRRGGSRAPGSTARRIIGDYCRIEAGRPPPASTPCSGANVLVAPDAYLERTVIHDNATSDRRSGCAGAIIGRSARPAPGRPAARRAWSSATSASSASTPCSTPA